MDLFVPEMIVKTADPNKMAVKITNPKIKLKQPTTKAEKMVYLPSHGVNKTI